MWIAFGSGVLVGWFVLGIVAVIGILLVCRDDNEEIRDLFNK